MARLTPLQRAFCIHYATGAEGIRNNGKRAYIKAGGKESGAAPAASRLLSRPDIQAEIDRLRREQERYQQVALANGDGGNGQPPPMNGDVYGPGQGPSPRPHAPMSPTERLTREFIIEQLLRNVSVCMGDEPAQQSTIVKFKERMVLFEDGTKMTLREAVERGVDTDKLKVHLEETATTIELLAYVRDAQGANRALELLDKQLDKLREDEANQPKDVEGRGENAGEYLSGAVQDKINQARKILGSKFKEKAA